MTNLDIMDYWIESSDSDYETMMILFKNHRNNWSLFVGYLVIEKLLKAIYAKNNKSTPYAPKSHDLLYLAEKCDLKLTVHQRVLIDKITKFNLNARYDGYKKEFQSICTDDYTREQMRIIEEVRIWAKELLKRE